MEGPKIMFRLSTDHTYCLNIFEQIFARFRPAKQLIYLKDAIMWMTLKPDEVNKKFLLIDVEERGMKSEDPTPKAKDNYKKLTNRSLRCNYVADIVKKYSNFRYGFISTIVDYGVDTGFVHQCGVLIDLRNFKLLFYEPYGTYIKYGLDYANPIIEFLECFDLPDYTSSTFHLEFLTPKYYSSYYYYKSVTEGDEKKTEENAVTKVSTEGIQNIILNYNNSRKKEFDEQMSQLLNEADKLPLIRSKIDSKIGTPNRIRQDDYTVTIVDALDVVVHSFVPENQQSTLDELREMAYLLYGKYNSKSCVSITLVEINAFLLNSLEKLYSDIRSGDPNMVLLRYLVDLITELKN